MQHPTILVMLAILCVGACRNQTKSTPAKSDTIVLRRSQLVGTWMSSSPPAFDPPMDFTYRLEEDGSFTMSLHLTKNGGLVPPEYPVAHEEGYWDIVKVDDDRDVIVIKSSITDEEEWTIEEVSIEGNTMTRKQISKDVSESSTQEWTDVLKRVKQ